MGNIHLEKGVRAEFRELFVKETIGMIGSVIFRVERIRNYKNVFYFLYQKMLPIIEALELSTDRQTKIGQNGTDSVDSSKKHLIWTERSNFWEKIRSYFFPKSKTLNQKKKS